jgi:Pyruvate/2-oxoacid:ferredoxin oxidoreductase delta subunit
MFPVRNGGRDTLAVTTAAETPGHRNHRPGVHTVITIDCPFCAGDAHVEASLDHLTCDGCGVTVEVAPDAAPVLEAAA